MRSIPSLLSLVPITQVYRLSREEQGALCLGLASLTRLTCLVLDDVRVMAECWASLPYGMLQRLKVTQG